MKRAVVVGGGIAGQAVGIQLADAGWSVDVLERDPAPAPADLEAAADWPRRGVPQFRQSHGFLPLFTRELRRSIADAYDDLLANGAEEIRLADRLPPALKAEPLPGDETLVMLAARRSTMDWALARAAARRGHLRVRTGVAVEGLETDNGQVSAVSTSDGSLSATLVVDAAGRRSPLLRSVPARADQPADEDCGIVYSTRFYRLVDGAEPGPLNRGFGAGGIFAGYSCVLFSHDNRTFSICCGRLPDDEHLKALRQPAAFEAAVRVVPNVAPWRDSGRSEPTGPVVPMAGLRTQLRLLPAGAPLGLVRMADAACTTNPAFGRGAALALVQARALVELAAAHPAPADLQAAYADFLDAELLPWHADAIVQDRARTAGWRAAVAGASPAPATSATPATPTAGRYPMPILAAAAAVDKHVWQAVASTAGMLRKPADLQQDAAVHARVSQLIAGGWRPTAPAAPTHADLAGILRNAEIGQAT